MAPTSNPTMVAAMFSPDSPVLQLQQVPKPTPAANEVLLRVRACGVCHSDIALLDGRGLRTSSFVAGHEICGEAVAAGTDVANDVTIGALYSVDLGQTRADDVGRRHALDGTSGLGRDGGYAQYVALPARALVRVPEGVTPSQAAVAADAGVTAYHAVFDVAKVKEGEKVLIVGAGGLGLIAVQLARIAGASQVFVADPRPHTRELSRERGADQTFSPEELDAAIANGLSVDVALDFVSVPSTFQQGYNALLPTAAKSICDARLVLVGVGHGKVEVDLRIAVVIPVRILGNLYGTSENLASVLKLIQEGKVKLELEESPLEKICEVLDDLRAGKIRSRMVIIPPV
ncbi:GroES-like protein [Exidia glandulosa HHB12029]|uniref:GroES-like protein n=1 Tax=Exidia glandulosa HHB12029 TaxID=1314781 RepID=A0A165G2K2_EXIGL|nr:GroES-like protein [Exidia glandulosa HHB12029]